MSTTSRRSWRSSRRGGVAARDRLASRRLSRIRLVLRAWPGDHRRTGTRNHRGTAHCGRRWVGYRLLVHERTRTTGDEGGRAPGTRRCRAGAAIARANRLRPRHPVRAFRGRGGAHCGVVPGAGAADHVRDYIASARLAHSTLSEAAECLSDGTEVKPAAGLGEIADDAAATLTALIWRPVLSLPGAKFRRRALLRKVEGSNHARWWWHVHPRV